MADKMDEIIITPRDIARIVELNKQRAELIFRKSYANNASLNVTIDKELSIIEASLSSFNEKLKKARMELVFPNGELISGLSVQIDKHSHSAIAEALKTRSGELYSLLEQRGKLTKRNYEAREEIGKLNILLQHVGSRNREHIVKAIVCGAIAEEETTISFDGIDSKSQKALCVLLKRVGLGALVNGAKTPDEVEVTVANRKLWVPPDAVEAISKNEQKMFELQKSIQLKNAERQIKVFSEEEELAFASAQKQYLELLKEKDALCADSLSGDTEFVYKFFAT
ncbi:MAG: hypothetical protein AABW86_01000 [Candidatus Micrarchaeota archaeon]